MQARYVKCCAKSDMKDVKSYNYEKSQDSNYGEYL
jgi:hypothetical protein